ncbi:large subunit ribosomal protein L6 [Nitrosomonas marina]|uniref:Large ribosomal subunit protein uL6 n=1 Tax=Nitrosomonas marina TaxID=917 RepID=A0A1I0EWU5_9PROT|nr:50S ribosomal protein L6 [Nitrosomonas marina]SET49863.1 large subunit ribosomal protein L6 [Nitrosomonas marina]
MSRISKNPVTVPSNVDITISNSKITVKGPNGVLEQSINPQISLKQENQSILVDMKVNSKEIHALSGTIRSLISNMVTGVTTGFERKLQLVGVGYRAQLNGNNINLNLGYSHPINYKIPDGINIEITTPTEIVIKGIDKQQVGQTAAEIRAYRKPEPYKGKGVRYDDEVVHLKEAKKK